MLAPVSAPRATLWLMCAITVLRPLTALHIAPPPVPDSFLGPARQLNEPRSTAGVHMALTSERHV